MNPSYEWHMTPTPRDLFVLAVTSRYFKPALIALAFVAAVSFVIALVTRKREDDIEAEPMCYDGDDFLKPMFPADPLPESTVRFSQEFKVVPDPLPPTCAEEERGKVDDEPILSDVPMSGSDLAGLAGYDQMKNEESTAKPGTVRVLMIDDGRSSLTAAVLQKLSEASGNDVLIQVGQELPLPPMDKEEFVMLTPEEAAEEIDVVNDELQDLRESIYKKLKMRKVKGIQHWIWPGSTMTFRKQQVRRVLWMWMVKDGENPDLLSDNDVLKNNCGSAKCIRPEHQTKVVKKSISNYKK